MSQVDGKQGLHGSRGRRKYPQEVKRTKPAFGKWFYDVNLSLLQQQIAGWLRKYSLAHIEIVDLLDYRDKEDHFLYLTVAETPTFWLFLISFAPINIIPP